jgi:hypothetical protein
VQQVCPIRQRSSVADAAPVIGADAEYGHAEVVAPQAFGLLIIRTNAPPSRR